MFHDQIDTNDTLKNVLNSSSNTHHDADTLSA